MILFVTGEGISDIGGCRAGAPSCRGGDFLPGPMAAFIDRLAQPIIGYSLRDAEGMEYVTLAELRRFKPRLAISGKKRGYETIFFFQNARALARWALDRREGNCPVGAVLFHDTDGTRSTEKGLFEKKWKSIEDGFHAEGFDYGVPMLPKPKSEAWLICALKSDKYRQCNALEDDLSGNDNVPSSAKNQLADMLDGLKKDVGDLVLMVDDGTIDPTRITMRSFDCFRERLEDVVRRLLQRS